MQRILIKNATKEILSFIIRDLDGAGIKYDIDCGGRYIFSDKDIEGAIRIIDGYKDYFLSALEWELI